MLDFGLRKCAAFCTLQSSDASVFDRGDGSAGSDWQGRRAAVEVVVRFEAVQGADDGASHRHGAEDVSVAGAAAAGTGHARAEAAGVGLRLWVCSTISGSAAV